MQLVLRYLPLAIIVIALAVIVFIVLRKLPKTAQLESELKEQASKSGVAGGATGTGVAASASAVSTTQHGVIGTMGPAMTAAGSNKAVGKFGKILHKTKTSLATVGKKIGSVVKSERFAKVLSIVKRKKQSLATPEGSATKEQSLETTDIEKQKIASRLLKEADDFSRQANWQAAEKVYIKAVALLPKSVEAYLGLGKLYLRQKNWDDAVASFREALKYDDANIAAWGDLGAALANKSEWVASVEALEMAAKLDPGNGERHAALGLSYMTIKEYKKAVKAYREAVKHDRDNISHKIELAKAAKAADDKASAEETLKEVLTREPLNEQAKELLKVVQATKELE